MAERRKKNRDINRQNMASSLVKATMYSNLVQDGLECIKAISQEELDKNSDLNENSKRKLESIIEVTDICNNTNTLACTKYQKCSTYVKRGSLDIANRESNLIKKALQVNEDPYLIKSIHHYDQSIGNIQRSILHYRNSKCHPSMLSYPSPFSSINSDGVSNGSGTTTSTSSFPLLTIPSPQVDKPYHTPLVACRIVSTYASEIKHYCPDFPKDAYGSHDRKVTKSLIMQYMITNNHVPIKTTAFRKLIRTYQKKGTLPFDSWTELTSAGRKPHLPVDSMNSIIEHISHYTDGGRAMDRTSLTKSVEDEIKVRWNNSSNVRYNHNTVPRTTMRRYMHQIMSDPAFNIQKAVTNKTESRSSAEWSIRSTVSYMCVVLATHFIRAKPSPFHPTMKSLDPEVAKVWELIQELNNEVLDINTINNHVEKIIPVLPHLLTSTDETTTFITSQQIKNSEVWYLFAKPSKNNKNDMDSSRRDTYSTKLSGDAHCRGLRITINNTFTAGGRCAPPFVCVYGLTSEEMPGDEIIIVPIKGLVASSNQNGSTKEGYILFIRGNYEPKINSDNTDEGLEENDKDSKDENTFRMPSKESRVAQIYREMVYYNFLQEIRTEYYQMDDKPNAPIPDNLTAVCWMDGCYGQLKLTTNEDVLKEEHKKKIICNKHSAARTAVEQAADVGPMFKLIKKLLRYMRQLHSCQSPVYQRIVDALDELKVPDSKESKRIVVLESHKRSAIISALSKLPSAMGAAFSPSIVMSAFEGNGQIDKVEGIIPSIEGMIRTYRGSIPEGHYLRNTDEIVKKFYKEVYTTGRIVEKSFDDAGVPVDRDSDGNIINRDFGIQKENCQRAKVLSATHQRLERIKFIADMKLQETERKIKLYDYEAKRYELNEQCEARLVLAHHRLSNPTTTKQQQMDTIISASSLSFADILPILTIEHFGKNMRKGNTKSVPTRPQLCAFAQV